MQRPSDGDEKNYPDDNPKTAIGVSKVPLSLVPPALAHHTALAFADGARKYGPYNWRDKTVSTSVYVDAMKRHIDAYWDGEDISEDAKVHHLGHAAACIAILLDAMSVGKLNDNRPTKGAAARLQTEYANKDKNDRSVPTYAIPAGDSQKSLLPMEGRLGQAGVMAGDSGSLCDACRGPCALRFSESRLSG